MGTTIYKFEEGRLLVHESTKLKNNYPAGSGVPFSIGQVRQIDQVLSVDNDYAKYGILTPLNEVRTSNNQIFVVMRRGDLGTAVTTSAQALSGIAGLGLLSAITTGINLFDEILSGAPISGVITVTANVIGY